MIVVARERADKEDDERRARKVEEVAHERKMLFEDANAVILVAKRGDNFCGELAVLPDVEGREVSRVVDKDRRSKVIGRGNKQDASHRQRWKSNINVGDEVVKSHAPRSKT